MSSPKRKNPRLEEDERAETGITQSHTEKRATLLPFHLFTSKVICNDLLSKTITVSGRFDDSSDLGVLVAEKTPLTHSSLQRLLVSCKVDKKFQNDVYSQYVLDSKEGSAGEVKVRMVYPATEEHVKKYAVQKLRFVLETPEIYQKVTKLYIERKSFSLDVRRFMFSNLVRHQYRSGQTVRFIVVNFSWSQSGKVAAPTEHTHHWRPLNHTIF